MVGVMWMRLMRSKSMVPTAIKIGFEEDEVGDDIGPPSLQRAVSGSHASNSNNYSCTFAPDDACLIYTMSKRDLAS